ncbi:MAG: hypothetical protein IPJ40_12175 [Saprospirales bacterium]|nr:hypothetical protein [Saprospirales bacterium]
MEINPADLVKWSSVALKSKAGEKIGSEISEAVNNEASGAFGKSASLVYCKDDPKLVSAFEEKPEESAPKGAFGMGEWLLEEDETFRNAVIESMKAIEKAKEASHGQGDQIKITGDHNIVLKDIHGGTIQISTGGKGGK